MPAQEANLKRDETAPRSRTFADRFGAFLRERGTIDTAAAQRALRAMIETGERYDFVLTRLGLVNETELAAASAAYLDLPFFEAGQSGAEHRPFEEIDRDYLREHRLVAFIEGAGLRVLVADPFDPEPARALAYLADRPLRLAVSTEAVIQELIDRHYDAAEAVAEAEPDAMTTVVAANEDDVRRLADLASEAPIIRLVQQLVVEAAEARASDIHLEPSVDGLQVRLRLDGLLHQTRTLPAETAQAVVSRIKIMAQLDIAERRRPQDGRIRTNVRGREIDLRVATIPTLRGENVVLRLLDRDTVALDFLPLGFSQNRAQELERLLGFSNGMILVTGPTGSGKTTTLYAALDKLNDPTRKIFTVEDPIEYQFRGINQVQVRPAIDFTFANALRSILRHDPDVIMVGEIRDVETARMAVQSALTGHLVLSTLHTNGAIPTIARLIDMGVEDYLIATTVKGVLAQRLVRRLCEACKRPARRRPAELDACLKALEKRGETEASYAPSKPHEPVGCPRCRDTGFHGRTAVSELLLLTDPIRRVLLDDRDERTMAKAAQREGMTSMLADGVAKVLAGETTLEEVLRVTQH